LRQQGAAKGDGHSGYRRRHRAKRADMQARIPMRMHLRATRKRMSAANVLIVFENLVSALGFEPRTY
jgi:hypothetical protein